MEQDGTIYTGTCTLPNELPTTASPYGRIKLKDGCYAYLGVLTTHIEFTINVLDGYSIILKYAKLELGSVATPYSPRPYGEELALCQRYYLPRALYRVSTINTGGGSMYGNIELPVPMRRQPTLVSYEIASIKGNGADVTSTITQFGTDIHQGNQLVVYAYGTFTSMQVYLITCYLELSAEL